MASGFLNDTQCKYPKPPERKDKDGNVIPHDMSKPFRLNDGEGMFLFVQPSGSRLWRMKYTFKGCIRKHGT